MVAASSFLISCSLQVGHKSRISALLVFTQSMKLFLGVLPRMINQQAVSNGVYVVSDDFATNSLNAILESVKIYRRLCRDALTVFKNADIPLTDEFERNLAGLKEIRVAVFVSTLAKAEMALQCKFAGEEGQVISVYSVSQLSSVLSAACDSADEGVLAQKAGMFAETLLKMVNKPSDISM